MFAGGGPQPVQAPNHLRSCSTSAPLGDGCARAGSQLIRAPSPRPRLQTSWSIGVRVDTWVRSGVVSLRVSTRKAKENLSLV